MDIQSFQFKVVAILHMAKGARLVLLTDVRNPTEAHNRKIYKFLRYAPYCTYCVFGLHLTIFVRTSFTPSLVLLPAFL